MVLSASTQRTSTAGERALGRVGLVVGGRYMLTSLLGSGAMGEVWRAHHAALEADVAIKLVHVPTVQDEAFQRLLIEARAAATIQSPYVTRSFDLGRDGELAYIAMELLEGETLDAKLARERKLSLEETARILSDVCKGVAAAHARGIIHRDLKPQNVFIASTHSGRVAKVLDFGIAKTNGTLRTQEGVVVGTPAYLSREQVLGTRPVDAYADLWALAIMAYECVTGRLPYDATSMSELFVEIAGRALDRRVRDPALPPAFRGWLEVALARDPARRFPDAVALGEALERALIDQVAPAAAPRSGRAPWLVGASALAATAAVVGVGALILGPGARRGATSGASSEPATIASATEEGALTRATQSAEPGGGAGAPTSSSSSASARDGAGSSSASPASAPSASSAASAKRPAKPRDRWGFE